MVGFVLFASLLDAACTKEQKTRLILNDVSQEEIDKLCGTSNDNNQKGNVIIINNNDNNNNNNNNNNNIAQNPYMNPYGMTKTGIEIRIGSVFGSGSASLYKNDRIINDTIDTKMSATKFQFGFTTETNDKYSYLYIGYQATDTTYTYTYTDGFGSHSREISRKATLFLFGAESAYGSEKLKFVFGGEFGFGKEKTNWENDYKVFAAEPYLGLRVDFTESISLNAKIGYRAEVMSANIEDSYSSYRTYNYRLYDFGIISGVSVGFKF